jgi:tRNA modification GTPase
VAVVRLSGPGAGQTLRRLGVRRLQPRRASLATLRHPEGTVLDTALVLWFPAPASYTGEDCAELHVHGGPAVVDSVMSVLAGIGLTMAAPGEFTRRAFENGKMDLGQAEAVSDLIEAETTAQVRQAVDQLQGALGRRYEAWRGELVGILAYLEAAVDFPDEDLPSEIAGHARPKLERLLSEIEVALRNGERGRQVREGYKIALVGAPNAGKSSLFNVLCDRDAAIVTEAPGTTRDVIEVPLDIDGFRVILADMAGVRMTEDLVEAEGVRRARAWAGAADLRLWVVDGSSAGNGWREGFDLVQGGDVCFINKSDLPAGAAQEEAVGAARSGGISVEFGNVLSAGATSLRVWLGERVRRDLSGGDFPATTRARHRTQLETARSHLQGALATLSNPELAAEDVRLGVRALGRVTGGIGVETVLDSVFSQFCIGK